MALAWDGQDVSRKASGLFDRHNLSKFLAPAADLLRHSLKLMCLETPKLLYAQFAMIIYRIILDAGAYLAFGTQLSEQEFPQKFSF
jgi:hypothetical protein